MTEETEITTEETEMTKEETEISKTLNTLKSKLDELSQKLSKALGDGKVEAEKNIKEHPLPYVTGALVGGAIIGSLIVRGRKK